MAVSGTNYAKPEVLYAEIREKIMLFEKHKYTSTDAYREYTNSLMNELSDLITINGQGEKKTILRPFYANPERAIAKVKEDRNLRLPVVSIGISDLLQAVDNRKMGFNLTHYKWFDVESRMAYRIVQLAAKPVELMYQVHIFARYVEDLNQLVEQMELKFHPFTTLPTKFGTSTQARIVDLMDQSTFAAGDQQDRVIHKTFTIQLDAHIPQRKYLYTSTGAIKEIGIDEFVNFDGDLDKSNTLDIT